MTPSFEVLLVLGVLGFYLYDAGMLLYINEAVVTCERGRWGFHIPTGGWLLLGRWPHLPNPIKPDVAIFRVHWPAEDQGASSDHEQLSALIAALGPLRVLVLSLLLLFFVALPLTLLMFGDGPQLLWVFAALYLNILWMLFLVLRRRKVFGLSIGRYLVLSFEALACAPFALNMLRKITLHHSPVGDPIAFARQAFDQPTFQDFVVAVTARVEEQLESADVSGARYASLLSLRTKIGEMRLRPRNGG